MAMLAAVANIIDVDLVDIYRLVSYIIKRFVLSLLPCICNFPVMGLKIEGISCISVAVRSPANTNKSSMCSSGCVLGAVRSGLAEDSKNLVTWMKIKR